MLIIALLAARPTPATDGDTTLRLSRSNSAIEVSAQNRDISVRVGTGDQLIVRGGSVDSDGGTVEIDGNDPRNRSGAIDITLPAWARIEVSTIGGNVSFAGTPERTSIETINGMIRIDNATGRVDLESVSGAISVTGFHGSRLSIDGTNQNITVGNITGELKIDDVNGSITMHGVHSASVHAETVNGSVEYGGEFAAAGSYDFSSQNSNITLIVAGEFNARVKVTTMNGALQSTIPGRTNGSGAADGSKRGHGDDDEHTITALYGTGEARVAIDAFNGNVIIKRGEGGHE